MTFQSQNARENAKEFVTFKYVNYNTKKFILCMILLLRSCYTAQSPTKPVVYMWWSASTIPWELASLHLLMNVLWYDRTLLKTTIEVLFKGVRLKDRVPSWSIYSCLTILELQMTLNERVNPSPLILALGPTKEVMISDFSMGGADHQNACFFGLFACASLDTWGIYAIISMPWVSYRKNYSHPL